MKNWFLSQNCVFNSRTVVVLSMCVDEFQFFGQKFSILMLALVWKMPSYCVSSILFCFKNIFTEPDLFFSNQNIRNFSLLCFLFFQMDFFKIVWFSVCWNYLFTHQSHFFALSVFFLVFGQMNPSCAEAFCCHFFSPANLIKFWKSLFDSKEKVIKIMHKHFWGGIFICRFRVLKEGCGAPSLVTYSI